MLDHPSVEGVFLNCHRYGMRVGLVLFQHDGIIGAGRVIADRNLAAGGMQAGVKTSRSSVTKVDAAQTGPALADRAVGVPDSRGGVVKSGGGRTVIQIDFRFGGWPGRVVNFVVQLSNRTPDPSAFMT